VRLFLLMLLSSKRYQSSVSLVIRWTRCCETCGINDPQIQKRLLSEPKLTFQKALDLSLTFEAATKDVKHLQAVSPKHNRYTELRNPQNLLYHVTGVVKPTTRLLTSCSRIQSAPHVTRRDIWHHSSVVALGNPCRFAPCSLFPPITFMSESAEYGLFAIQQQSSKVSLTPLTTVLRL